MARESTAGETSQESRAAARGEAGHSAKRDCGLVFHPDCLLHLTGPGHPERPERLTAILDHLRATGRLDSLAAVEAAEAGREWLETVHDAAYVARVEESCLRGDAVLDSMDTGICPDSYRVALLAAGGLLAGLDAVVAGRIRCGLALVRPPGHHAERGMAMGFCLFNNVAVGARYLQRRHGLERVAIVDFDVHHGNGTQHAFEGDGSVLYVSLHQWPHYPGTGAAGERGKGAGEGATLNIPLPPGSGDEEYLAVLGGRVLPALREFHPDFLLLSAGFDAHRDDPLSEMRLSTAAYREMALRLREAAERSCDGRLFGALEGGYDLRALPLSVEAHLEGLQGR